MSNANSIHQGNNTDEIEVKSNSNGHDNSNSTVQKFIEIYGSMSAENLHLLDEIYDQKIEFLDPIHRINGLKALRSYLAGMYQNVGDYELEILSSAQTDDTAFLEWEMKFSHPSLNKGNQIEFVGVSKIKFNEKVFFHQDYYDLGAMLYEYIPVFGSMVKMIKKRAAK